MIEGLKNSKKATRPRNPKPSNPAPWGKLTDPRTLLCLSSFDPSLGASRRFITRRGSWPATAQMEPKLAGQSSPQG
jgi:hypothetical protein